MEEIVSKKLRRKAFRTAPLYEAPSAEEVITARGTTYPVGRYFLSVGIGSEPASSVRQRLRDGDRPSVLWKVMEFHHGEYKLDPLAGSVEIPSIWVKHKSAKNHAMSCWLIINKRQAQQAAGLARYKYKDVY